MKQQYYGWRKSSRSNPDTECVEIGRSAAGMIGVRDSKSSGSGPVLEFTRHEWDAFIRAVRAARLPSAGSN